MGGPRFSGSAIPVSRIRGESSSAVRPEGAFVLYWMTASRRSGWNFALQRAVEWARELKKPLVVVEVLPCGGRWDNQRRHAFILQGMADNAAQFARHPALYYPYVESAVGGAAKFLTALAARCCVVVADDYPLPAAGRTPEVPLRLEKIDSNGLLPTSAAERPTKPARASATNTAFTTAASFRRFLQRTLPDHLLDLPQANPLARAKLPRLESLPAAVARRWPRASPELLAGDPSALDSLPICRDVAPAAARGGTLAARAALREFLVRRLARYDECRNHPDDEAGSGLSPYLHHGHISVHEIFRALADHEHWSPDRLSEKVTGKREGWWGLSGPAEAFLDELVTWRELGFNFCSRRGDYDQFNSLPDWARATLGKHARDRRPHLYTLVEFEAAASHDPLWNAAQRELAGRGRIHNYLRMLWGKKILEWSATPQEALSVMIELNNKYALDGCDPNSYSGIFWVLGRYDRPWGPERPVFGTVRWMSSDNTLRKCRAKKYLARYGDAAGPHAMQPGSRAIAGTPQ
jgi:deoxyribodipyrimidine photo-lyase